MRVLGGGPGEADHYVELLTQARGRFVEVSGFDLPRKTEALRVEVLPSKLRWAQAIRNGGAEPPSNQDFVWYRSENDTVYLRSKRTPWLTRYGLLYGAFVRHFVQGKKKNNDLADAWFVAGLAAHIGRHTWDGEVLECATWPLFTSLDLPGQALPLVDPALNPPGKITLEHLVPFPERNWAVVSYLLEGAPASERKRFRKRVLGSKGSKFVSHDLQALLGDTSEVYGATHAWLLTKQQPLKLYGGNFYPVGTTAIEGKSGGNKYSIVGFREPVEAVSFRLLGPEGTRDPVLNLDLPDGEGGELRFGLGDHHVTVVSTHRDGEIKTQRIPMTEGGADEPRAVRLAWDKRSGTVTLHMPSQEVGPYPAATHELRFDLRRGGVRLEELEWTLVEPQ